MKNATTTSGKNVREWMELNSTRVQSSLTLSTGQETAKHRALRGATNVRRGFESGARAVESGKRAPQGAARAQREPQGERKRRSIGLRPRPVPGHALQGAMDETAGDGR